MRCVHMHWRILAFEGCGNPNHVQNVMEKDAEDNQKAKKVGLIINQMPTLRLEHDKIWTWWVSIIVSDNMLKGYDGANALRWNFENKPFVVR